MSNGGTFISYRREDAAGFAGRLCDSLERLLPGEPIFRDVDGLTPGQDFVSAIDTRLRQCRVCLAVIGRQWLNARTAEGGRRRIARRAAADPAVAHAPGRSPGDNRM